MSHLDQKTKKAVKAFEKQQKAELEALLHKAARWSNRATPEEITVMVIEITRGLLQADEEALARYEQELAAQGVAREEREEKLQQRFSQLSDDRERKIHTLSYFLRTTHEVNKQGN